jgi:hypothetical protein
VHYKQRFLIATIAFGIPAIWPEKSPETLSRLPKAVASRKSTTKNPPLRPTSPGRFGRSEKCQLRPYANSQIIAWIAGARVTVRPVASVTQAPCLCAARGCPAYASGNAISHLPLVAPIKAHLTLELANHIFHNACAEPAVRGRRGGRPTRLDPAQAEPSVCCKGP